MYAKTCVLAFLTVALSTGCDVEVGGTEDPDYDPAGEEQITVTQQNAIVLTKTIPMRSGAWWGDVRTPLINQVWGEIANATPGKNLTSAFTYQWSCNLPRFDGFTQTLKLTTGSFSIDSTVVKSVSNPAPGAQLSFTLDPSKYSAGWHEIRIRCKGTETTGGEAGEVTAITAGFPVQLNGGSATFQNHSGTNYVDTHGWYSRGIDYVYATILNISDIVGQSQHGTIALDLKARTSGDTTLDHFMVKIDDKVATMTNGSPAEFHGATDRRTIYIDTRQYPNGMHKLAMHSHGLEISTSEHPGQQLAAQVEVYFQVQN